MNSNDNCLFCKVIIDSNYLSYNYIYIYIFFLKVNSENHNPLKKINPNKVQIILKFNKIELFFFMMMFKILKT